MEWISVDDELPPNGEMCLVCWGRTIQHSMYSRHDEEWVHSYESEHDVPLHTFKFWLLPSSLPAPPE